MAITIVKDEKGFGRTIMFGGDNIEYVDPISHLMKYTLDSTMFLEKTLFKREMDQLGLGDSFFFKRAIERWKEISAKISSTQIPPNYIALLNSQTKGEQISLLKSQSLTPWLLTAIEFFAYQKLGFRYSLYNSEKLPSSFEDKKLPVLITLLEDDVKTVGKTELSKGQQKQLIEQRKVVVSHFFDKGDVWHCFFSTYNGLGGKENWQNGKPHFHYISDKWGISRDEVLRRFKSGNYPSTPVHIELNDY